MSAFKNILSNFRRKHILVIGDVILDQHIKGSVNRISPEAPVPILLQEEDPTFSPGGSANVANNLRSLGANVTLVGRIGRDAEGQLLLKELKKRGIKTNGILTDPQIPTILKTRIIAHHQQVVRVDREKVIPLADGQPLTKVSNFIRNNLSKFDAIIISDYGKGMITPQLLSVVCTLAINNKKIIAVDPKVEHFGYYQGVTAITPNRKEAENAIHNLIITHNDRRRLGLTSDRLVTNEDIEKAGLQLLKFLKLESLLMTLGEQGMCLIERGKKPVHIHTRAQEVFDVTGAGDTVIAVFTLGLCAGASKSQAADLANFAAGVVVGKMGAATVSRAELLDATKEK